MADKPDREKRLPDAKVCIYHAAIPIENGHWDRMVVQYFFGDEVDVVVYKQSGERKVARLRTGLTMVAGSSPAIPVSTGFTERLEPMDAEVEKRMLAIYDLVESTGQPDS